MLRVRRCEGIAPVFFEDIGRQHHILHSTWMMAPSASTSSALKTVCIMTRVVGYMWITLTMVQLIRVTAFGLGAAYGGQRLASLQAKKREQDGELRSKEVQEAVAKALAQREQEEAKSSMSHHFSATF